MGIWVCLHCPWEPMVSNEPLFAVKEFEVLESFEQLKNWGFENPCAEVALEVEEETTEFERSWDDLMDPNNKIQRWPQGED
jgi:hypothetical protein